MRLVQQSDLPHLLRLLDDPSETVQQEVVRAFADFGLDLEAPLKIQFPDQACQIGGRIHAFLYRHRALWIEYVWPKWRRPNPPEQRLEQALALLASYQQGPDQGAKLTPLLDQVTATFLERHEEGDALTLAAFLFEEEGFEGAREDYYLPRNSDLVALFHHKEGIPITLACLYILVGRRLGFDVEGCNWPGHFLARAQVDGTPHLIDGYHQGLRTREESFLRMQGPSRDAARRALDTDNSTEAIIARVLHNLIRAYQHVEDWDAAADMTRLLRQLKEHNRMPGG
jgi:regulator of sirC expression with transglutaminase-like and TPR domain